MAFQFEGKVMTEENFDHLETGYIYLNFTPTLINNRPKPKLIHEIQNQTFSAAPSIAPNPSNPPYKPRSQPITYEDLSPKQKALYDRCKADAMVPEATRLNEKLFNQVANKTAAFAEKILPTVSQTEFDSFKKSFALSKEEERLQKLLLDQVAGNGYQ